MGYSAADYGEKVALFAQLSVSGGFTRVILERTVGTGLADSGVEWDIPTSVIPRHLRGLGSRFILITDALRPEEHDSAEDLRSAIKFAVEEMEEQ